MTETPRTRWSEIAGAKRGYEYAATFAALAAAGEDVHGEASLVATLAAPGARVLDAGCGTGRVAIRLAELGFDCAGADLDESMLAEARRQAPDLPWHHADLSTLELDETFDVIVLAGNVIPLLAPDTLTATVARLAAHLRPKGLLICGFGLDPKHLPGGCPVTDLTTYDAACAEAGLTLTHRYATWDQAPADPTTGYAVSVHTR